MIPILPGARAGALVKPRAITLHHLISRETAELFPGEEQLLLTSQPPPLPPQICLASLFAGADSAQMLTQRLVALAGAEFIIMTATMACRHPEARGKK